MMAATDPKQPFAAAMNPMNRTKISPPTFIAMIMLAGCGPSDSGVAEEAVAVSQSDRMQIGISADDKFEYFQRVLNETGFAVGESGALDDAQSKALILLREAAVEGHAESQLHVGHMLVSGTVVPEDRESGTAWLLLAAQQGNTDAQSLLGMEFAKRIHEPIDDDFGNNARTNAIYWLDKASGAGDMEARELLGFVLVLDYETKDRGIALLEEAAAAGSRKAQGALEVIAAYIEKSNGR